MVVFGRKIDILLVRKNNILKLGEINNPNCPLQTYNPVHLSDIDLKVLKRKSITKALPGFEPEFV